MDDLLKPIQGVEVEQQILGCILVNNDAMQHAEGIIGKGDFYDPVHGHIFEICKERIESGNLASPVVLKSILEGHEGLAQLGGPAYLARLAGAAISVFAVRDYCTELRNIARRRALQGVLIEAVGDLREESEVETVVGKIEAAMIDQNPDDDNNIVSLMAASKMAAEAVNDAYQNETPPGVRTGIADLDRKIGGFAPGELILLGGRPSMGKSACALSIAINAARRGVGVAIASLEMTPDSMAIRAVSNETAHRGDGVPYSDARRGAISEGQARSFFTAIPGVADLPIFLMPPNIRDMGGIYAGAKKSKRLLKAQGADLGLLIVDYLQLISPSKTARGRTEQITEISIALKSLAMRLKVPVLALSQLSRALESRENKRPLLSDLRDSGQLEQDADMVLFCYRHEYYLERDQPDPNNPDEVEAFEAAMNAVRGRMEIIVSKQRQGEIGTVHVGFNAATNFIWDEERGAV